MRDDRRPPSLDDLDARLRKAREAHLPDRPSESQSRQFGAGYRVFVELLAGVLVGGFIGWLLDQWLGTRPWLLVAMIVFGFAAGISNAYRSTRRMVAEAERRERSDNAGGTGG